MPYCATLPVQACSALYDQVEPEPVIGTSDAAAADRAPPSPPTITASNGTRMYVIQRRIFTGALPAVRPRVGWGGRGSARSTGRSRDRTARPGGGVVAR